MLLRLVGGFSFSSRLNRLVAKKIFQNFILLDGDYTSNGQKFKARYYLVFKRQYILTWICVQIHKWLKVGVSNFLGPFLITLLLHHFEMSSKKPLCRAILKTIE